MSLGQRIREKRKEKKLTQIDVARKLGVDNTTISKWESDVYEPDADTLAKLAALLDVTTDYLLTGRTEQKTDDLSDLSPEDRAILEKIKNDPDLDLFFKDFASAPAEHQRDLIKIWKALHGKEK